jgi:serine/threonine-protein kinase
MTAAPKVIAPRESAPVSTSDDHRRLPDELLNEQVRRLRLCAAVATGLWAFGLVMDAFVRPGTVGSPFLVSTLVIEAVAIAGSGLLFAYLRFTTHAPRIQAHAGLVFMVLNAMGVGLLNTWARPLTDDALNELSWNTIVILVGAMLIPGTPKQMLVAAAALGVDGPARHRCGGAAWPRGADGPAHPHPVPPQLRLRACGGGARHHPAPPGRKLRHARELGSYHLEQLLGRGGMGEVWLGRHRLLARAAAVKLVRPELLGAGSRCRGVGDAAPVRARGAGHGVAQLAAFDSPVRLRHHRGPHLLLRDGAAGRARLETVVREFGPLPADRVIQCCARCVTRWPRRTRAASCTATSRPPTSICAGWGWTTTS